MKKNFLTHASASLLPAILLILALGEGTHVCPQSANTVVAIVNGREIKQQEVDALLFPQVMPLEQQLYAIRKAALENLILTTILEVEARERNISLEELRKTLTAGRVEVKSAEVETAYAENISAFAAMSPDEVKERLRLDLESQARMRNYQEAIKQLRQKARVQFFLEEPRLPALASAVSSPSIGAKNGAITIVEFADFQCPYCRDSQSVIREVLAAYRNDVKLIFKHLPLDIHPEALTSARAAFCAGEQSLFWKYHDALFSTQSLSTDFINRAAATLSLDMAKFEECLKSDVSRDAVLQDKKDAARWGINSTPTFVVNGTLVRGAVDFETFKTLIEREIESARTTSRSNALAPAKR